MGSFVENVNKVASLIPERVIDLNLIAGNIDSINLLSPVATDLKSISTNIVPNITEILQADTNAAIATEQAQLATTNGQAQVALATTQAGIASTQAGIALNAAAVISANTNINFGAFSVNDGELVVTYFDGAISLPSLIDGEFIITY